MNYENSINAELVGSKTTCWICVEPRGHTLIESMRDPDRSRIGNTVAGLLETQQWLSKRGYTCHVDFVCSRIWVEKTSERQAIIIDLAIGHDYFVHDNNTQGSILIGDVATAYKMARL